MIERVKEHPLENPPAPFFDSEMECFCLELCIGFAQWGKHLRELLDTPIPLWIHGQIGCGSSTLGRWCAQKRGKNFLEDADRRSKEELKAWLDSNPIGVACAHCAPMDSRWMELRIPCLEEQPDCIEPFLKASARSEQVEWPLPKVLGQLPCPGNLRELRNRVLRYKLLGQLPEPSDPSTSMTTLLSSEVEDLATHLHALEKFLLHRALRRSYGNRSETAQRLGISHRQLYILLARHGDPIRGELPSAPPPLRLQKKQKAQNSSTGPKPR